MTEQINKKLHELLCLDPVKVETPWSKKPFDVYRNFTTDPGRIELLRIMSDGGVLFAFDDYLFTAKGISTPEEAFLLLTETTGEHKLCCAVIEFLEREGKK